MAIWCIVFKLVLVVFGTDADLQTGQRITSRPVADNLGPGSVKLVYEEAAGS